MDVEVERAVVTLGELDWLCGFLDEWVVGRISGGGLAEIWGVLFMSLDAPQDAPGLAAAVDAARMDELLQALWTLDRSPDRAVALVPVARDARDHLEAWLERHQGAADRAELDALRRTRAEVFRQLVATRTTPAS